MNRSTHMLLVSASLLGAGFASANHASAAITFGSVTPTKANGDFIPGGGIAADQFTIDTAGTGESIALKARDRSTSEPIARVGSLYTVLAGNDPSNVNRSRWNFDFQFSPGAGSSAVASDYTYELKVDIDPAVGVTNFVTIPVPPSNIVAPAGDSFFANPGGGAWSDNTTPFVIANSENYKFGFIAGPTFTNPDFGEYDIQFSARDAVTNDLVAQSNIQVVAIPEPATLGVLGLASLGLLARRRRRQLA